MAFKKDTWFKKLPGIIGLIFVLTIIFGLFVFYLPLLMSIKGWKTYKNQTYGYQLKVPQNFVLSPPTGGYSIDDSDWKFRKNAERINWNYAIASQFGGVNLDIYTDTKNQDFNTSCNEKELSKGFSPSPYVSKTPPMLDIDSNEYVQISGTNEKLSEPYWNSVVCFVKGNKRYMFVYRAYQSRKSDPTLYLILSNFKFTK